MPHLSGLEAVLDETERAQAERFARVEARQDYMAAHVLLRVLLAERTGRAPSDLRFGTGQHGKPILDPSFTGLDFSLSHADGRVGCALSTVGPIGLDLESTCAAIHAGVEAMILAPDEIAWLATQADRRRALLCFWVLKEAMLKAAGTGFMIDPRTVVVRPGMSSPCRLPAALGDLGGWWLSPFEQGDHLGAIALYGAKPLENPEIGGWDEAWLRYVSRVEQ